MSDQTDGFFGGPIYTYTDQQALEDGVLVAIAGEGGVNRVTRAVFDHFVKPIGDPAFQVFNVTPLMEAIRVMLKIELKEGWRTGMHDGKELWLVPNEVGGFTLMFSGGLLMPEYRITSQTAKRDLRIQRPLFL